jgi:hypothetical protein
MAQLQAPYTFATGDQVTAANLNAHTNSAILLPGSITDQPNIEANTVASGDSILLYDLSATGLREANVSDVLGSNVPVTTSAITAGANSDIVVTPNDGTIVTGQAYTSADGLTVTVTSTAHTLTVGQVILVTAAATGYNGTFWVATVATNSFTYVMTTAATAGSSTLSYTKKGAIRNAGSESINGSLFVAGSSVLTGDTTISGALTYSGTANFTGALQVNGTVGYVLTEIVEETVAPFTANSVASNFVVMFTSSSYTKPSNEIWCVEIIGGLQYNVIGYVSYKLKRTSGSLDLIGGNDVDHTSTGAASRMAPLYLNAIENTGTSFTSTYTFEMAYPLSGYTLGVGQPSVFVAMPATKFRIYKYKTA